jgi:ribosomal protein L30/L7E
MGEIKKLAALSLQKVRQLVFLKANKNYWK